MVISAETSRQPSSPSPPAAASSPPAASRRHDFSFPTLKTWGTKKILRCLHVNGNGEFISGRRSDRSAARIRGIRTPPPGADNDSDDAGDLEAVRAKLLSHLREAADRISLMPVPPPALSYSVADSPERPWNLRKRRGGGAAPKPPPPPPPAASDRDLSPSPSRPAPAPAAERRTIRLRSEDAEKREERPRFSISLSRDEIDEDIYAVTGCRARRRPRKRPRAVQKQLDALFPGSWLTEITADSYKVPE